MFAPRGYGDLSGINKDQGAVKVSSGVPLC